MNLIAVTEAFPLNSTLSASRVLYIVSIDNQLRKVRFTDSDSNSVMTARLRKATVGQGNKLPLSHRQVGSLLLLSKMVVGWIDVERVRNWSSTSPVT